VGDANTIRHARCGQLVLLAHGMNPPSDEEWAQYVEVLGKAHGSGATGLLVLTDGPGPHSTQRKLVSSFDMRTAVLTPSQVARGMVTALSWFGLKIRSFTLEQIDDALTFLEVDPAEQTEVCRTLAGMRLELAGRPAALASGKSPRQVREMVSSSLDVLAKR
jgi:hypothetical protein